MRQLFPGMSLVELLITVAILGLVTIFAIPSFRALQGRQDMRVAQGVIQSAFYRLDQLAVAPPAITQDEGKATDFDIVGYGLVLSVKPENGIATVAGCTMTVSNDFMAVVKYVRAKHDNNDIKAVLMPVNPADPGICNVSSRDYPEDIYVLPARVGIGQQASVPKLTIGTPWLVTQTLASVGTGVGNLGTDTGYTNPFRNNTNALLAIRHRSIKIEDGKSLCYGVSMSRNSESVELTNKVGCNND